MDDFSSSASSSARLLEDLSYSSSSTYLSSVSATPFLVLPDSYTSSSGTRQISYSETSSERRARLEFLENEKSKEEMKKEDRARSRVASWVQTQVDNSAFLVMAAAAQSQKQQKQKHHHPKRNSGSRGHCRTEPQIAGQRSGSPLRFSYVPSDVESEEPEEQDYCIPLSLSKHGYPSLSHKPHTSSKSQSSYTSKPHSPPHSSKRQRRQRTRRLASSTSSLDSIPEE